MRKESIGGAGLALVIAIMGVVVVLLFIWAAGSFDLFSTPDTVLDYKVASERLDNMLPKIEVTTLEPRMGNVSFDDVNLGSTLPDISTIPLAVEGNRGTLILEIFSSTEKATEDKAGADNWLLEMAREFNKSRPTVDGVEYSIAVRGIASGLGRDFIATGEYRPTAFSPSNELWGDELRSAGVDLTLLEGSLVGNVAGIVIQNGLADALVAKYGELTPKVIIDATIAGDVVMGYTNPNASSTGANWLLVTLHNFSSKNLLSAEAVAGFEAFQSRVPFVAYTTLQMTEAAKSGSLTAFIFEAQQFMNTPELRANYTFIPFGVRHDSPLYLLNESVTGLVEKQGLLDFIAFCKSDVNQKRATNKGFNNHSDYNSEVEGLTGELLTAARKLWKEKKNANRDIIVVFVSDNSGSMDGAPLAQLQEALLSGAKYISQDCEVGLVTFSSTVQVAVPIAPFDLTQRSYLVGATESMVAAGGTAMLDGILVASDLIRKKREEKPNAKFLIIALTDGETNEGFSFEKSKQVLKGLGVPIHVIGYNLHLDVLEELSLLNEAAYIKASSEDVVYKIISLFNAEM